MSGEGTGQVNVTAMTLGPGGGSSVCPVSFYLNQKYRSISEPTLSILSTEAPRTGSRSKLRAKAIEGLFINVFSFHFTIRLLRDPGISRDPGIFKNLIPGFFGISRSP